MAGIKKVANYENIVSQTTKEEIISDYVDNFLSIRDISKKYNIKSKSYIEKILGDKKRNASEGSVAAHIKHPESFKHNEKTKAKLREIRLKYIKEHPENTAWRQKNISYPERCFINILYQYGFSERHLIYKEYSVYPYYIDFAFINEKLAVEIDGSQHLQPERAENDRKKDKLLTDMGWCVLHFTAFEVMKNTGTVVETLGNFLKEKNSPSVQFFGDAKRQKTKTVVVKHEKGIKFVKTRQPVAREENGRTKLQNEASYKQRKCKRPSKEDLNKLIQDKPFRQIGKMFGVSDNTIRKWCKYYNLPHRKKDILSNSCE